MEIINSNSELTDSEIQTSDWSLEKHLEELRNRILFSIIIFLPSLALGFYLVPIVLQKLEALAPQGTVFFQLKPGELLFTYFKLTFTLSLLLVSPFWLQQIAAFILPGLTKKEKNISLVLLIGGPFLFVAGAAFAYYIALRPLLSFILGFGVDLALIQPQYSLDYFVSLVTSVIFMFGIAFQLPILLFVLAMLDLISSTQLIRFWKEALFGAFLLAAVLTPTPDPINMSILGLALGALYGLSIFFIKISGK